MPLIPRIGPDGPLSTAQAFLFDLASEVQRTAYFGSAPLERGWDRLHGEHELQMSEGFISANEHDDIRRSHDRVSLQITRCRFHECFRGMGSAAITEAFCRSDEAVFNDFSPTIRFHRAVRRPTRSRAAQRPAPSCSTGRREATALRCQSVLLISRKGFNPLPNIAMASRCVLSSLYGR
jgi:hypothetical protein